MTGRLQDAGNREHTVASSHLGRAPRCVAPGSRQPRSRAGSDRRSGALAGPQPAPVVPHTQPIVWRTRRLSSAPGFESDVKPLFREMDRDAMESAFDLWEFEDVRDNAQAILASVEAGGMPCDGAWPPEQVAVLRSWIEAGMPA